MSTTTTVMMAESHAFVDRYDRVVMLKLSRDCRKLGAILTLSVSFRGKEKASETMKSTMKIISPMLVSALMAPCMRELKKSMTFSGLAAPEVRLLMSMPWSANQACMSAVIAFKFSW